MIKYISSLLTMIMANLLVAQPVEMADGLRSDGKIYVVVTVLSVVLISLFVYLFKVERKIKDLENKE